MEEKQSDDEFVKAFMADKSSEEIRIFADDMRKMMVYYRCAMREVETKFLVLGDQFSLSQEQTPIDSIKTRLKSPQSIHEKLKRLNLPYTCQAIEKNLNDVAGIRVICNFIDDVYMLAECLISQDDIRLIQKKDYIENPKPNGYRSLHLIVEIPIFLCNEKRHVRVEVQLRTIAMESWANLEHRLRYKKNLSDNILSETADMLNECANLSNELDIKMQRIRSIVEDGRK